MINKKFFIVTSIVFAIIFSVFLIQEKQNIKNDCNSINIYDYPNVIEKTKKFSLFLREFNTNTDDYIFHTFHKRDLELVIEGKLKYDFFNYYDYKGLTLNQFLTKIDSVYGRINFIDSILTIELENNEGGSGMWQSVYYRSKNNFILEIHISFPEDCFEIIKKGNRKMYKKDKIYNCNKFDFIVLLKDVKVSIKELEESPFLFLTEGKKNTLIKKIKDKYEIE